MKHNNSPHDSTRTGSGAIRHGNVIYPDFGTKQKLVADPASEQLPVAIPDMAAIIEYVKERIVSRGLAANDPIFWKCAEHAPRISRKAQPLTLDTQIGWAMSQANRFYSNLRPRRQAAQ
jgi:hypothetical protein